MYALTSAAVVHTVADRLTQGEKRQCATLNRKDLLDWQKWVDCSPDVHSAIKFAKNFMDSRVENASVRFKTFVQRNSEIGRLVSNAYFRCL